MSDYGSPQADARRMLTEERGHEQTTSTILGVSGSSIGQPRNRPFTYDYDSMQVNCLLRDEALEPETALALSLAAAVGNRHEPSGPPPL